MVEIVIADETAVARISSRFMCSECGRGYNTVSLPPKTEGVCDLDGAPLVQRDDDKPEAVKKRLALYHEQTAPVIEFYRNLGVPVHRIDGEQSIDDVLRRISTRRGDRRKSGLHRASINRRRGRSGRNSGQCRKDLTMAEKKTTKQIQEKLVDIDEDTGRRSRTPR